MKNTKKLGGSILAIVLIVAMSVTLFVPVLAVGWTGTATATAEPSELTQLSETQELPVTIRFDPAVPATAVTGHVLLPDGWLVKSVTPSAEGVTLTYSSSNNNFSWTASGTMTNIEFENIIVTYTIPANADIKEYEVGVSELTIEDSDFDVHFNMQKVSTSFEIKAPVIPVEGISLDKTELTLVLTESETAALIATVTPDTATDKTVTWTSSDESVATVADGTVTAKSVGTATITAKAGDKEATCNVTVVNPAADAEFTISEVEVQRPNDAVVTVTLDTDDAVAASVLSFEAKNAGGEKLTLKSIELIGVVGAYNIDNGKISFGSSNGTEAAANLKKGDIATLIFATTADTTLGDYTVTMTGELTNAANQAVSFNVNNGKITVVDVADVEFDTNGGTPATIEKQTVKIGEKLDSSKIPTVTKTGYTFAGWQIDGTTTIFKIDTDKVQQAMKLVAQWTPITYTIAFDGNGATSGSTASVTATYDQDATLTANGFTKTGYTFQGWAETDNGAKKYDDGATVKNLTAENEATVTLYAVWQANNYTVKFDKNHADATGTMDDQSFTYDVEQALTANAFERTGYDFQGWATTANGSVAYADKASVKNLTERGEITLYAVWTEHVYKTTIVTTPKADTEHGITVTVVIKDSAGNVLTPNEDGTYDLTYGEEYTFTVSSPDFSPLTGTITVGEENPTGYSWTVNENGTATLEFDALVYAKGDVDGSGTLTVKDAQELYNYLVGNYDSFTNTDGVLTGKNADGVDITFIIAQADVNQDGSVNVFDIVPMLNLISKYANA